MITDRRWVAVCGHICLDVIPDLDPFTEDSFREDRVDQLRQTTTHLRSSFSESVVRSRRSARSAGASAGGRGR